MSSDTEIYIKTEMDDSQEINIENIEQFIKVEVDENVSFDGDLMNKSQEVEENELTDDKMIEGLTEEELNHIEWLQMKTQSLDSMKGKYNSQLQEYLRLAELRKTSPDLKRMSSYLKKGEINNFGTATDESEEKTIIPSRKRQQSKRAERADTMNESISQRMRQLEIEALNFNHPVNEEKQFFKAMSKTIKPYAVNNKKSREVENPKKLAHKKRKVELERERRKSLTQLFDEMDYWVELGEKDNAYTKARLNRFQKLPYSERTNAAIKCITRLESSTRFKESVLNDLRARNEQLRLKLENLKVGTLHNCPDEQEKIEIDENTVLIEQAYPERKQYGAHKPLYTCDKCTMKFKTVQDAFIHEGTQHCHLAGNLNTQLDKEMPGKKGSDQCMVYKCKHCPTVCLDSLVLQVHKFLHQDLTYFFCPDCEDIFGVPSKLKRHYFLSHEKILDSELEHVLDMESRVDITLKIQKHIMYSELNRNAEVVDNFLDASLDAKLIMDEIAMTEEVESIPLKVLGPILGRYLDLKASTKTNPKEELMSNEILSDDSDIE